MISGHGRAAATKERGLTEIPPEARLLIACEGRDELEFLKAYFWKVFPQEMADGLIHIQNVGGNPDIRKGVRLLRKQPAFQSITHFAIVRDSEHNPQAAVQSVQGIFGQENLPVPAGPGVWADPQGSTAPNVHTGLLLFPTCDTTLQAGTLEDFALRCLADENADIRLELVDKYLTGIRQTLGLPVSAHLRKQRFYSYLSGLDNHAGNKIGEAAKTGAFN